MTRVTLRSPMSDFDSPNDNVTESATAQINNHIAIFVWETG